MPRPRSADPSQRSLFDDIVEHITAHFSAPSPPPAPEPAPAPRPDFGHPRAARELQIDGHRIAYELRRARRRSIGFVVGPEGLTVSAPRWVGVREIESALLEKGGWVLRKLREQRERSERLASQRIDWRDGTVLPFLGDNVILLLDARTTGVVLDNVDDGLPGVPQRLLHVGLPHTATPEQIRDAVQGWLQRQAKRIFEERCALFAQRLGVRVKRLALSSASTRWGSASADGSIRLNWRLVHFGLPIIDYVVAHELAHLREMNHSAAFWDVVRSVLPDYEASRGALREQTVPQLD
jgi:predicted metal-dependent hydrolase